MAQEEITEKKENVAGSGQAADISATQDNAAQKPEEGKPEEKKEEGKAEDKKPESKPEEKKEEEKKTLPFVHLHVHTEMSLLDGAARLVKGKSSPLLKAAQDKGMPGIAITDHGNMFGVFTFYKKANAMGLHPIIGCEFYTCDNMYEQTGRMGGYNHLLLLAKDDDGYRNLIQMDSMAYVDGFYYKPRIDINLLKQHTKGVICLSACLSGKIPELLLSGDYEGAKNYAIMLRDMFEPGDFYIELQDHGIPEQKRVNPLLVKLAKEIGVKVVATNDVHYIEKSDAQMHDVLLCIQTGKTIDDPNRMKFDSDEFYLKTYDEMMELFSWCPEAVTNTIEVMEKCHAKIEAHDLQPPYVPEDGSKPEDYLRRLAYDGLKWRYGEITPSIKERAEYELNIIITKGFAEYYLTVWDYINYAKTHGIPVGAGRGSGVGSIIAYAIQITNVDPLRYNLLFERFLNPERESPPDFDVDFCFERRGEVIDYVTRKYGKDKVCQILALGTMKAKGAIKDVARVYNVPLPEVNKLTKAIANDPKITLDKVLGRTDKEEDKKLYSPEVVQMYNENPQLRSVIDMALKIEGMPRNCTKHAAGVVICREVISDFVPLQRNGEDITTQFQKEEVEEMGMLKMDFLGLKTLTDIAKTKQYIKEDFGVDVDFQKLGYDDPNVYKLISTGETDAVFQLESVGMKKFMQELRPESLEDIIAGISLYRPGPMDAIPDYIRAKNNPQTITYKHPMLEPILNMTYGTLVYQEQVMQIVQKMAGYSLGSADLLRRAMGKKKVDEMKKHRDIFLHGAPAVPARVVNGAKKAAVPAIDGALKRGIDEDVANEIFDEMENFAKYAFNKSHAAAYAVLAYETAYFKRYYNIEFIAAVINNRITNADEVQKYLNYLKDNGYTIYPPDVNKSYAEFHVENGGLRYGLGGVKNVGEAAMKTLVEERKAHGEYKSISDMLSRLPAGTVNKRIFENLIKAGAFDCFGHTRASLMASYESMMLLSSYDKKKQESGQLSLFDFVEEEKTDDIPALPEFPKRVLLSNEKEVLNIYMSGHPLDEYREVLKKEPFTLAPIANYLKEVAALRSGGGQEGEEGGDEDDISAASEFDEVIKEYSDKTVSLCGMLTSITKKVTKTGKLMGYGTLEDMYATIELVFFPNVFAKVNYVINEDSIVRVIGRLNLEDSRASLLVSDIKLWAEEEEKEQEEEEKEQTEDIALYVKVDDNATYEDVKELLDYAPGSTPVFVQFNGKLYKESKGANVKGALLSQLKGRLGENFVKLGKNRK